MKVLLLGFVLLGSHGLPAPAQDVVAPPTQVSFDSVDFKNMVHWTPPRSGASLQFFVQWKIYGEQKWLDADGCQGIREPHCDLSRVTSIPREWYYARVRAAPADASSSSSSTSTWTLSSRFCPRWDTKISPPTLRLNLTREGIVVRVKPQRALLRRMHSNLLYKVYLQHSSGAEDVFEMSCCSSKLTVAPVTKKTRYCLQAQTIIPLQTKRSARSPVMCVTTL